MITIRNLFHFTRLKSDPELDLELVTMRKEEVAVPKGITLLCVIVVTTASLSSARMSGTLAGCDSSYV
jgi:hypothetical protein